jgi:8-oxo-dGTP pyrophosphatase MutT (NUDIX family)
MKGKQPHKFIRPLVICLFRNDGRFLASLGTDSVKDQDFYRPLGGMIEFGETSEAALKREIKEELGEEITNIKYLGTTESLFTYEGGAGHEIVMAFDAEFINRSLYAKNEIDVIEGDIFYKAYWINIEDLLSGKVIVYPEGIIEMIG